MDYCIDQRMNTINISSDNVLIIQLTLSDIRIIIELKCDTNIQLSYRRFIKKQRDHYEFSMRGNIYLININRLTNVIQKLLDIEPPSILYNRCTSCSQSIDNADCHINCAREKTLYHLYRETPNSDEIEQYIYNKCTLCRQATYNYHFHINCDQKCDRYHLYRETPNGNEIEEKITELIVIRYLYLKKKSLESNELILAGCFEDITRFDMNCLIWSEKFNFLKCDVLFQNHKLIAKPYIIARCLKSIKNGIMF